MLLVMKVIMNYLYVLIIVYYYRCFNIPDMQYILQETSPHKVTYLNIQSLTKVLSLRYKLT